MRSKTDARTTMHHENRNMDDDGDYFHVPNLLNPSSFLFNLDSDSKEDFSKLKSDCMPSGYGFLLKVISS